MVHTLPAASHFSISVQATGDVTKAKAEAFDALVKAGVMNVKPDVFGKDGKRYDIYAGFARKMPAHS